MASNNVELDRIVTLYSVNMTYNHHISVFVCIHRVEVYLVCSTALVILDYLWWKMHEHGYNTPYVRYYTAWMRIMRYMDVMHNTEFLQNLDATFNLSSVFANNNSADQPAHPRSLISAFVISFLESIILLQVNFQFSS